MTSLLGLLSLVMDDQAVLEQYRAQQRVAQGGAGGLAGRMDTMRLGGGGGDGGGGGLGGVLDADEAKENDGRLRNGGGGAGGGRAVCMCMCACVCVRTCVRWFGGMQEQRGGVERGGLQAARVQ